MDNRFGVTPAKVRALELEMERVGIRESDLEESFIRSSGPGGQKSNKSNTAVVLRHLPTGVIVHSRTDRSQALNRFFARRMLCEKVELALTGRSQKRDEARAKERKQKDRRRRRASQP